MPRCYYRETRLQCLELVLSELGVCRITLLLFLSLRFHFFSSFYRELPSWYKSAIFNELYFISDGGSIWIDLVKGDTASSHSTVQEFGRFGYLEGKDLNQNYKTFEI